MYYTYILRCVDNTLYTGITTDVKRRLGEHCGKKEKGAKYTRMHTVKNLEAVWESADRASAMKLEYQIKRLSKAQKETLIQKDNLADCFSEKISCEQYQRIQ